MNTRFFFDKSPVASFEQLVSCYADKEFLSPTRSTIPLLSFLKENSAAFQELMTSLDMPANSPIHLEYKVFSPLGKGNASHTDAMVIGGDKSLAIEAKWTEGPYENVEKWLKKGPTLLNRQEVMEGWLKCLQKYSKQTLSLSDFSKITYQMVHRAASACATGRNPKLLYLYFTPLPDESPTDAQHLFDGLKALHGRLGSPESFPFYIAEMAAYPTEAFREIAKLPKDIDLKAKRVVRALKEETLFDFEFKELRKI